MDILQAAVSLSPGTAWNLTVDTKGHRTLTQAIDNSPRVAVPDLAKLDAIVASYVPPLTSEQKIDSLQAQLNALQQTMKATQSPAT